MPILFDSEGNEHLLERDRRPDGWIVNCFPAEVNACRERLGAIVEGEPWAPTAYGRKLQRDLGKVGIYKEGKDEHNS